MNNLALKWCSPYLQRCLMVGLTCYVKLLPSVTHVLCAPYNHAPVSYSVTHFSMRSHTRRVHACIAVHVTCTFGRMTDKDRLRANAVKRRRWNGYRNDRQHSMLNLERKKKRKENRTAPIPAETGIRDLSISCPALRTSELVPAPNYWLCRRGEMKPFSLGLDQGCGGNPHSISVPINNLYVHDSRMALQDGVSEPKGVRDN